MTISHFKCSFRIPSTFSFDDDEYLGTFSVIFVEPVLPLSYLQKKIFGEKLTVISMDWTEKNQFEEQKLVI